MPTKTPQSRKKQPEPKMPADLNKALRPVQGAEAQWKELTPIGRRDFIRWIEGAKQTETRKRRIEKACSLLKAGKKRPCCYAIIPMEFYRALGASKQAKAHWRELTPTERRDLIAWIEAAKDPKVYSQRIGQACMKLAAGKFPA